MNYGYSQVPMVSENFDIPPKKANNLAAQLKTMLVEIEAMLTARLTENVPREEQSYLAVRVKMEKAFNVSVCLYNGLTKAIIIKNYSMYDLLNECSDIFRVTAMVDQDSKTLYNKSKEQVFNQNTTLYI